MTDSKELLQRSARLARLDLSDGEAARLAPQLEAILRAFGVLAKLEVVGIPPTVAATLLQDVKRVDSPEQFSGAQEFLAGAPDSEAGCFRVPRAFGNSQKGDAQ